MEYKYTLNYKNGDDVEVTMSFDADLCVDTLRSRLRCFLLACSWQPETLHKLLGNEELDES